MPLSLSRQRSGPSVFYRLTLILALLLSAQAARGLDVREVGINYRRFVMTNYMLETPGFDPKESVNLTLDVDLLGPLYWNNTVRTITDDGAYRFVSWNFFLGARILPNLNVEFEHRSGHLLDHGDEDYPDGHFPVEDSIGLQWVIHSSEEKPVTLFH